MAKKLYLASPSRQNIDVFFRIPEIRKEQVRTVPAGGQIDLIDGFDLTEGQITGILNNIAHYGIVHAKDAHKRTDYQFTLFYQHDKPIDIEKLKAGIEQNAELALKTSDQARADSMVSAVDSLNKTVKKEAVGAQVLVSEVTKNEHTGAVTKKAVRTLQSGALA